MSKFSVTAFACLICVSALLSTTEGRPPRLNLRCKCIENNIYSGQEIPRNRIISVKVIPAGVHCKRDQIIVTMKKMPLCLDPAAEWVIRLINGTTTTPKTLTESLTTAKK